MAKIKIEFRIRPCARCGHGHWSKDGFRLCLIKEKGKADEANR